MVKIDELGRVVIDNLSELKPFYVDPFDFEVTEVKEELKRKYFEGKTDEEKAKTISDNGILKMFDTKVEAVAFANKKLFEKHILDLSKKGISAMVMAKIETFGDLILTAYNRHSDYDDDFAWETRLSFNIESVKSFRNEIDNIDETKPAGLADKTIADMKTIYQKAIEKETRIDEVEKELKNLLTVYKIVDKNSAETLDMIDIVNAALKAINGNGGD